MNELVPLSEFEMVREATLVTITSGSARIYDDTYKSWVEWCMRKGVDTLDIQVKTVKQFLLSQQVTKTTRQRQLYALRKLAQVLMVMDYSNLARKSAYEILSMFKVPEEQLGGKERDGRALSVEEVNKVLDVWAENDSLVHVRNQAMVAMLFATGARRAELIALRWPQVDIKNGTIEIKHGKGDKKRYAAIFGHTAVHALHHWHVIQDDNYQTVFTALNKHNTLGADKALTADNLYRIVRQTSLLSGVEWRPHDARRTLATALLNKGLPIAEVQAQLGHADPSTTLGYAKSGNAAARRVAVDIEW